MNNTCLSETNSCQTSTKGNNDTIKQTYRRPHHEVRKLDNSYEIDVFVPGCNKEGISLEHERGILKINASRTKPSDHTPKSVHRELSRSDYKLSLRTSNRIDVDNISAKTEDGILTITLPIAESALARQIEVS